MSTSTFFIALPITLVVLALIRAFWIEVLSIILTLQILWYLFLLSFGSAIIWSIFIMDDKEGFWTCWLYFGIVYVVATLFAFGILGEIFDIGIRFIRNVFKIK